MDIERKASSWEAANNDPGPGSQDGGSGGSGSGGSSSSTQVFHTASGHEFDLLGTVHLQQSQIDTISAIVDYGKSHNMHQYQIHIAVNQAFYESSLGLLTHNPSNSSVTGLYQYNSSTWSALGRGSLDINSQADQIHAMYDDIVAFGSLYSQGFMGGAIPTDVTFDQYIEVKHHLGSNSTDWHNPVVSDYQNKEDHLGFYDRS